IAYITACPGSDTLRLRVWRWRYLGCCASRSSLSKEAPQESVEGKRCIQTKSGDIDERFEYNPGSSKSAHTRHVPLSGIRGCVRRPGNRGGDKRVRPVSTPRDCRDTN